MYNKVLTQISSYALGRYISYSYTYEAHMSSALNGSSAIRRLEGSDAIEICDGITFDFYTGLPHMKVMILANYSYTWYTLSGYTCIYRYS